MKIVGIVSFFNVAGAPAALVRLLSNLKGRGHDVTLVGLYQKAAIDTGSLDVCVLEPKPSPGLGGYVRILRRMPGVLSRERPDAVVGFLPLANVLGLSVAAMLGVKRRVASQRVVANTFGKAMRIADRWAGTVGIYSQIVCVSHAVADSFAGYPAAYRKRIRVVHNGIDWRGSRMDRAAARKSFDIPDDAFAIVAVGRLSAQKNYGVLLDALTGMQGVRCLIAGDGELRDELEVQAQKLGVADSVVFTSKLPADRVADLLCAADAFVMPSRFEGQSNALLEAMYQGLPCVVGNVPEQIETITDPLNGELAALVADVDTPAEWRDAVATLQGNPRSRASLGQAARELAMREFSLARMIDGFEQSLSGDAGAQ